MAETDARLSSLGKALSIVDVLADAGPAGLALRDVAEAAGLNKASCHRLLQTLVQFGYAQQGDAARYSLGGRPASLATRYLREENLPGLFRPMLLELSRAAGELVHLGLLESRHVLYLDKVEPDRAIRVWSRVGRQVSVSTTALGRAMVAAEDVPLEGLAPFTEGASTEQVARFTRAVREARRLGYATEIEENEAGICCVAAALVRPSGASVAISITGPATRMAGERIAELGELLRTTLCDAPAGFALTGV